MGNRDAVIRLVPDLEDLLVECHLEGDLRADSPRVLEALSTRTRPSTS
jgi:hypothetical protein